MILVRPQMGVDAHVDLDWTAAIRYHDRPEVLVSTARIGGKSFTLGFAFRHGGETTATGSIVYVVVATDGSGTIPLPPQLVEALGEVAPLTDH
ncbi:acyl-CoA thioesterase [Actinoallomurus sp. CA-150999]|uniref:acyl-CoA thioesterase n=1 Tax=Actinoallomurus sp. CA-150999 TaxID=3239887 RepID=UPI003D8A5DBD